MYDLKWQEKTLIAKVQDDFFNDDELDCTEYIGNIDFCVVQKQNLFTKKQALFWAEAKRGEADNIKSLIQLILTIGKEKTHEKHLPPEFIGAFDARKIYFVPFNEIADIFNQNDFNWNITPSDKHTKEFKQLYETLNKSLENKSRVFEFFAENDEKNPILQRFIKNLRVRHGKAHQIGITHNNFFNDPYHEWIKFVKPSINTDFENPLEYNDFTPSEVDFYLADLFADEKTNKTISKANLRLTLQDKSYLLKVDESGKRNVSFYFKDCDYNNPQSKPKAHSEFWERYERPPKERYRAKILDKRHLLAPKDKREYQGAFYTPKIWAQKAKEYLEKALGKGFEKEYIIWDCAAGTGNLLEVFDESAKGNIYASTLDESDVKVMLTKVKNDTRFPLYERHIFQFDFLKDSFFDEVSKNGKIIKSKVPEKLQKILKDDEARKKLLIFINPPYAEATSSKTIDSEENEHKPGVAINKSDEIDYLKLLGRGANEIFAQFLIRIYIQLNGCVLGQFSKLKIVQAQNFAKFRDIFKAKFLDGFVCPSNSFDNVKGKFPIGFMIWDTNKKETIKQIWLDIYEAQGSKAYEKAVKIKNKPKAFFATDKNKVILNWLQQYYDQQDENSKERLAYLVRGASDFQNNRIVFIDNQPSQAVIKHSQTNDITAKNLIPNSIFYAVRRAIEGEWYNDRDQFLYPNDKWQKDTEFQNDCLVFTLFHGQNQISSEKGTNHFIPFTEAQVGMRKDDFESHFMSDFISGQYKKPKIKSDLELVLGDEFIPDKPLVFSTEAKAVFDAGREIWRYYHTRDFTDPHKAYNANASLYDIKAHFQGRNDKGRMNARSDDAHYNELMTNLRNALKELAEKITSKLYDYGFLLE